MPKPPLWSAVVATVLALVKATGGTALRNGVHDVQDASLTASKATTSTAGCGKAPTLTSGSRTLRINGKSRSYIPKVPANSGQDHAYRPANSTAIFVDTMTYALACSRATVFRAVAVQSGWRLSGCDGGTRPMAYLGIHGIRDNVLGISGGRALRDRFVRNNGCTPQNPPEPAQGSLTHRFTTCSGCSTGHPVEWAAFDDGHIPAPQDGDGGDSGSRTWVPAEVWKFFTQF